MSDTAKIQGTKIIVQLATEVDGQWELEVMQKDIRMSGDWIVIDLREYADVGSIYTSSAMSAKRLTS